MGTSVAATGTTSTAASGGGAVGEALLDETLETLLAFRELLVARLEPLLVFHQELRQISAYAEKSDHLASDPFEALGGRGPSKRRAGERVGERIEPVED